jgi:hypothetical protein
LDKDFFMGGRLASFVSLGIVAAFATCAFASSSDVLKNADGSVRIMNQYDALRACPVGSHLPTIRELAMESHTLGAGGILEIDPALPNQAPVGYVKIAALNADGKTDQFYFSWDGYRTPDGDLGDGWVWSSSLVTDQSSDAFVSSLHYGGIFSSGRDDANYYFAVRCFTN